MAISQGVSKQVRIQRQTAKGLIASAGAGFIVRRESSTFELAKETYTTESEITTKRQLTSSRHGIRMVNGKLTGILSPGTYSQIMSAILMRDFVAVPAITGASITIAGTGPSYTVTRAAGSFLTDGTKIGMVVRLTVGGFSAANLNKNLFVTAVTATALTVLVLNSSTLIAEGPIVTATLVVPGMVTFVPETGHTNVYYTVEEWASDVPFSERNTDVKFTQCNVSLPGSGNAKVDFTAMGLDQSNAVGAYFTAPAAETTSESVVAAGGILIVNGVSQAIVTDLSINIDGKGTAADGVVGSNIRPDIFTGKCMVSGSFTAYFDSGVIPLMFVNETTISILSAVTASSAANAEFVAFSLSRLDINSNTPADGETGLKRTYNYVAEYNPNGGPALANSASVMQIQDSLATL